MCVYSVLQLSNHPEFKHSYQIESPDEEVHTDFIQKLTSNYENAQDMRVSRIGELYILSFDWPGTSKRPVMFTVTKGAPQKDQLSIV